MLRVASSVKSETGSRQISDYMPADAKAIQDVLADKTYLGKDLEANVNYLTAYQQVKNKAGVVVGMLYTATRKIKSKPK